MTKDHALAEAMSEGLIRECPKCKNRFFKMDGCNKMTCRCKQVMCYVCRKAITGYDHFHDNRNVQGAPNSKKCPLFDNSADRNEKDVEKAKAHILASINDDSNMTLDQIKKIVHEKLSAAPSVAAAHPSLVRPNVQVVHHPPAIPARPMPPPVPIHQAYVQRGRNKKRRRR